MNTVATVTLSEEQLIRSVSERLRIMYQQNPEKYKCDYQGLVRGVLHDHGVTDFEERERLVKIICSRKGRAGGKAPRTSKKPSGQIDFPFGKTPDDHIKWMMEHDPDRLAQVSAEGLMAD